MGMEQLRTRDVIKALDQQTRPPKKKRLICVCERRPLFLWINSHPLWPPHIKIKQCDCPNFLDWDSYVELRNLVRVGRDDLQFALTRDENPLGRLTDEVTRQIAFAAQRTRTLNDEQRLIIWEGLVGGS